MRHKATTYGKLREIRSLHGRTLRIDIENGSHVVIFKESAAWRVSLDKRTLPFAGTFNAAIAHAWEVVRLVDSDCQVS